MTGPLKIGSIVRYATGGVVVDKPVMGRVNAVKTYEDEHGRRLWWVVRWFDPSDGDPVVNEQEYHENELEVVETAPV